MRDTAPVPITSKICPVRWADKKKPPRILGGMAAEVEQFHVGHRPDLSGDEATRKTDRQSQLPHGDAEQAGRETAGRKSMP